MMWDRSTAPIFVGAAVLSLFLHSPSAQTLPSPQPYTQVTRGTVAQDIALGPKGGWLYVAGSTTAPDYAVTPDAFDRTCGTDGACNVTPGRFGPQRFADVVLSVFDPAGRMRYSTFLGGAGQDDNPRIAVARNGKVWLSGATSSSVFEHLTTGCPFGGWIARFDYTLRTLQGLRCLPGVNISDIAVDAQDMLWVVGVASVPNLPTRSAWQPQLAGQLDMYVAQFDATSATPRVATYIGGRGLDVASSLAITPAGHVAIVGSTNSHDFPLVRAVKPIMTDSIVNPDAVVLVLDRSGLFAHFSTYWGGNADENAAGLALDADGNLYVTGHARSANMPATQDAIDTQCGTDGACDGLFDAYVTKFSPTGTLLASTFYGGRGLDSGRRIASLSNGQVVLLGTTQSADFPLIDGIPSRRTPGGNAEHTFLAVFDDRLTHVARSTFVLDDQYLPNVATLAAGNGFAYVAGQVSFTTGLPEGIGTYLRAIRLP